MAWIMLDGVDRCGKSTVAEMYRAQGYKIVHLMAPSKKYFAPGYCGPGYVDEMMTLYILHTGQNVVFDRTVAADVVWAEVYGRKPQLSADEIEALREIEDQNDPVRILMYDEDVKANWHRCIANKEKLTLSQFNRARQLFEQFAETYGFQKKQLSDFPAESFSPPISQEEKKVSNDLPIVPQIADNPSLDATGSALNTLERANAIRDILTKKRIVKKDHRYDFIEQDIRNFLNDKLRVLLGQTSSSLSQDEVAILKIYCHRIKNKMESTKHE